METSTNESSAIRPHDGEDIGRGIASDLERHADDIKGQAKAKAHQAARSGQTAAADELHHLAEGMRRSVESWDESQDAWIRQGLSTAADSLERFSSNLRDRDVADLAGDMEMAVRRHPVIFVGACAMAGFALVRFLKSSRRDTYPGDPGYGSEARSRGGRYASGGAQDNL